MSNYHGIAYPLTKTVKGFFYCGDDIAQIKASMLIIILTRPGERVFELGFGTPLDRLNFRQPFEMLNQQARTMVAGALKRWEKRVQVTEVQCVFTNRQGPGVDLSLAVFFLDPKNLHDVHQLTVQVPVGTGER